jgi:hypothetical protein
MASISRGAWRKMKMDWLEAAFGFGDEPEPAAKPVEPPCQAPKVQSCCVVVRQPSGEGDLGEAIDCHFYVDGDYVVICTATGKPTEEEKRMAPGDDPRSVAKRLARDAWRREQNAAERVPGFGRRRLNYEPLGQA